MIYGWKYPVEVDPRTGKIKMNDLQTDIKESIKILIKTRRGERIGRPGYGSEVERYMFASIDESLMSDVKYDIEQLVSFWEKRIEEITVDVRRGSGDASLLVDIRYNIKELNQADELSYEMSLNND